MKIPLFFLLFLIGIVFIGGCTQTPPGNNYGPATKITSPPATNSALSVATVSATLTTLPPSIPVPPKDPIIGTWVGYKYLATGRIQLTLNFMENNTFILINTNMKSQHKKYVYGTWKKESTSTYPITTSTGGSDAFTYDKEKDEISDTFFLVPFVRVTDPASLVSDQLRAMNLTLTSAYLVKEFNGSHYAGNKYLVTGISIRNFNETGGYSFTDERIRIVLENQRGLTAMNQKLTGKVENPFPSTTIGPGEMQQGTVVFGVPDESQSYIIRLISSSGYVISNDVELNNVPVYATDTTSPN
jgi:hypothetical protein